MTNYLRNGDFLEWPAGADIVAPAGTAATPLFGQLRWDATGASQPSVTFSQQEFTRGDSITEGLPRNYLRVTPATVPALGSSDAAFLVWDIIEESDWVFNGNQGIFTFYCKAARAHEIVVKVIRNYGTGGSADVVFATESFQLSTAWKKYEVRVKFNDPPLSTYGPGSFVSARVYLQGGSAVLGNNGVPWVTGTVDFSQFAFVPAPNVKPFDVDRLETSESGLDPYDIRRFGALPGTEDAAEINTLALQRAMDNAITSNNTVKLTGGVFFVTPWSDSVAHTLICGYSSFTGTGGITSATNPVTPRQDFPQFGSLLIEGIDTGKRLVRLDTTPDETYTHGAVLKFVGDLDGKVGIMTGYRQRNIRFRNITFVGTGHEINSIGIRHNVSSSHFELENCSFWHWGTAIDLGGDYADAGLGDQHADFNSIKRTTVFYCGVGLNIGPANAYITTLYDCDFSARICVRNLRSIGGTVNSPQVNIIGGFYAPLTEYGGIWLKGTVTAAAGQTITISPTITKYVKSRDVSTFVMTLVSSVGSISDVASDMIVMAEKNCNATGNDRPNDWGVLNTITAIDTGTRTLTLAGTVDTTSLVGATVHIARPAIGLYGDHFNVLGAHFEGTRDEDLGFGPIPLYLYGWKTTTAIRNCEFQFFEDESVLEFNAIKPFIYHQNYYPTLHGFSLIFEGNTCNVSRMKIECDPVPSIFFKSNIRYTRPLFLNHLGTVADGIVEEGESTFIAYRTSTLSGSDSLASAKWMGKDRYIHTSGIRRREVTISSAAPTVGATGEVYIANGTPVATYRIGGSVAGYYDPATITALGTINIATDPNVMVVDSMAGLYPDRVISIAGAGSAGGALGGRILDCSFDGTTRRVRLQFAASTNVTNAVISAVAPTVDNVHLIGTADSVTAQLIVQGGASGNDIMEFRRTNGVTQSYAIRLDAGNFVVRDKTNGVDLFHCLRNSNLAAKFNKGLKLVGQGTNPTTADVAAGEVGFFMNTNGKAGFVRNDGGTLRWLVISLDGATTTWSTTAP